MAMNIVWKNQSKFMSDLRKDIKSTKKKVGKISEELADLVVEGAKRRVPVLTGNLKSKIYKRKINRGHEVVADTDYAALVEFGSSKNQSKPFLTPAFNEAQRQVKEIVDEAIDL